MFMRTLFRASLKYNSDEDGCSLKLALLERKKKKKKQLSAQTPIHSSLSGEGNGTPLQYSCLDNPMDRGAWWAAVHWVEQSRT